MLYSNLSKTKRIKPMNMNISIDNHSLDNSAFSDNPTELKRIVLEVLSKIEQGHKKGVCLDINGNSVGKWTLS